MLPDGTPGHKASVLDSTRESILFITHVLAAYTTRLYGTCTVHVHELRCTFHVMFPCPYVRAGHLHSAYRSFHVVEQGFAQFEIGLAKLMAVSGDEHMITAA